MTSVRRSNCACLENLGFSVADVMDQEVLFGVFHVVQGHHKIGA